MSDLNIPDTNRKRVVVIGAGFGGINVIKHLRNSDYQVVLIDRNNYHLFQPLLYQVATGGLEAGSIAFPIRKIIKGYKNVFFRITEVENIDVNNNIINTSNGSLSFDYLVTASGSTTNFFGNDSLVRNSLSMKRITEALDIRSYIIQNFEAALEVQDEAEKNSLLNFIIVGGGPTGVELAGALSEMKKYVLPKDYPELDISKMNIILMEAGDRLISGMSEKSSLVTKKYLEQMGVKLMFKALVNEYENNIVRYNNSETINASTLIWAAGVKGENIKGFNADQLTKDARVVVNEFNQVKNLNHVFAIGDVAAMITTELPIGHPMLAQVAIQQGKNVANNLKQLLLNKPMKPFSYFDKGVMATIGRNKAVAETFNFKLKGWIAWQAWLWVHLLFLIGFRNKVFVFIDWLLNYITYDRAIRLVIRTKKK